MTTRKTVFITGASSGIGLALAYEFAGRHYDLALAARRTDTLESLKNELATRDPKCTVRIYVLDVTNCDAVSTTVKQVKTEFGQLDIAIANAGIGPSARIGNGQFDRQRATIETNVVGAMATCDAAVELFKQQGFGHVVVISSVAAFRGLPTSSAYSASKAAIATYAEALRAEVYHANIKVTTIFPGFIDTPINQHLPNRPFVITTEKGARIIVNKIERGVAKAIVPAFPWTIMKWLVGLLPTSVLAGRAPRE